MRWVGVLGRIIEDDALDENVDAIPEFIPGFTRVKERHVVLLDSFKNRARVPIDVHEEAHSNVQDSSAFSDAGRARNVDAERNLAGASFETSSFTYADTFFESGDPGTSNGENMMLLITRVVSRKKSIALSGETPEETKCVDSTNLGFIERIERNSAALDPSIDFLDANEIGNDSIVIAPRTNLLNERANTIKDKSEKFGSAASSAIPSSKSFRNLRNLFGVRGRFDGPIRKNGSNNFSDGIEARLRALFAILPGLVPCHESRDLVNDILEGTSKISEETKGKGGSDRMGFGVFLATT